MARFRLRARVSLRIDDLWFSASVAIDDEPDDGLAAELATYATPADLRDLEAVLDRYDDADTGEIRAILEGQARHRLGRPWGRGPLV